MTKAEVLANPNSCLNKADSLEPIFVLRGNDPFAAQTVRLWIAMAAVVHNTEKIDSAREVAMQMEKWRTEHEPKSIPSGNTHEKIREHLEVTENPIFSAYRLTKR